MILSTVSYLGGFGTFAQVLLALPMALDLLGRSRGLCDRVNLIIRPPLLPTPFALVHCSPLSLFHTPSHTEEYSSGTPHFPLIVHITHYCISMYPCDTLLLPQPTNGTWLMDLPEPFTSQCVSIPVRIDFAMGVPVVHVGRGSQHALGDSSSREGG